MALSRCRYLLLHHALGSVALGSGNIIVLLLYQTTTASGTKPESIGRLRRP